MWMDLFGYIFFAEQLKTRNDVKGEGTEMQHENGNDPVLSSGLILFLFFWVPLSRRPIHHQSPLSFSSSRAAVLGCVVVVLGDMCPFLFFFVQDLLRIL